MKKINWLKTITALIGLAFMLASTTLFIVSLFNRSQFIGSLSLLFLFIGVIILFIMKFATGAMDKRKSISEEIKEKLENMSNEDAQKHNLCDGNSTETEK